MKRIHVAIIIVAIIAVALGVVLYVISSPSPQESGQISVSVNSFSGKAGNSITISLLVSNSGGDATGVIINLQSTAFGQVSSSKIDVSANETKSAPCTVQISDSVANGQYPVAVSYTYNGKTNAVDNHPTCYVIPPLEVVNQFWYRPSGYPLTASEKSTIGSNDNTTLYFHIKNDGKTTYTHLSATSSQQSGTLGLTITPNFSSISDVGPAGGGTSQEYSFNLASHNMPPGAYTITIKIFSDELYEAGSLDVALKVTA